MKDKRSQRTRFKLKKISKRNRLSVFKSNNHLYAQIIDDISGTTLASASSLEKTINNNDSDRKKLAETIGKEIAKRSMFKVPIINGTIPHKIIGKHGASRVMLKPAAPGTGIIAGGPVRSVMEQVGVHNILTKRYGSKNAMNLVYATLNGLLNLKDAACQRQIIIARLLTAFE